MGLRKKYATYLKSNHDTVTAQTTAQVCLPQVPRLLYPGATSSQAQQCQVYVMFRAMHKEELHKCFEKFCPCYVKNAKAFY